MPYGVGATHRVCPSADEGGSLGPAIGCQVMASLPMCAAVIVIGLPTLTFDLLTGRLATRVNSGLLVFFLLVSDAGGYGPDIATEPYVGPYNNCYREQLIVFTKPGVRTYTVSVC